MPISSTGAAAGAADSPRGGVRLLMLRPEWLCAVAALCVLLAIGVRESLWYDECLTLRVARTPAGRWWDAFVETESSPPLYFMLARAAERMLGNRGDATPSAIPVRLPSILATLALVLVMARAARRLHGARTAMWLAPYVALQPFLLWYGAEGRPYALWTVLLAGALVMAVDLVAPPEPRFDPAAPPPAGPWRAASLLMVFGVAALFTHYFAALPLAVVALVWAVRLVLSPRGLEARWSHLLAAVGAIVVALIPIGLLLATQAERGHTAYIPPPTLRDLVRTFFVVVPFGLDAAIFPPLRLAGALAVAIVVAFSVRRAVRARRDGHAAILWREVLLLAWFLVPPLTLFAFAHLVRPVYLYDRYPIMAMPAFLMLVAGMIAEAVDRPRAAFAASEVIPLVRLATIAIVLLAALWQAVRYANPSSETIRTDWRALAVRATQARALAEDASDTVTRGLRLPVWIPDELHAIPFATNGGDAFFSVEQDLAAARADAPAKDTTVAFLVKTERLAKPEFAAVAEDATTLLTERDLTFGLLAPAR